ncbi:MAG: phosphoglucosamine mutase [Planctomycetota bacterium]
MVTVTRKLWPWVGSRRPAMLRACAAQNSWLISRVNIPARVPQTAVWSGGCRRGSSMSDAPLIVGVSGLRGVVGESLTPEVAVRFAGAFGGWLREQEGSKQRGATVVVARDGRYGGEAIYHTVIGSLLSAGCRVCPIGIATTPTVGVVCDRAIAHGAVIVTASHNPQQWNGLKLLIRPSAISGRSEDVRRHPDACAPDASVAAEIIARFDKGSCGWAMVDEVRSIVPFDASLMAHTQSVVSACLNRLGFVFPGEASIVIDAVNSSAPEANRALFKSYRLEGRAKVVHLFSDDSGRFPHTPEPTAENLSGEGGLCDAVPGLKADVGFAQDPDADRLAIVDENGRYIGEEYTLVIAAEALLSALEKNDQKPVIVVNLSTSRMIEDVAARHGAEVVRTPVGEANVVERMKALKAEGRDVVLGGEGNGGVIWPEVCFVRDSLSAMALTLSLMARTGKTVSGIVALIDSYSEGGKGYCIVKRKTPIASKADAKPACEKVEKAYTAERVDTQDGVRVDFSGARAGSWVHVRASNTEPIMRLICEAPTEGMADAILAEVEGVIGG